MKKFIYFVLALTLAITAQAGSQKPLKSPLLGSWSVDISKLPLPPHVRPTRVTVTFSQAGTGKLATRVEVIDSSGALMYAESVTALDGTPAPVQGNLEADTAATSMPTPTVLIMQLARANVPGSTRIYTVAPNGKSMIETAANYGDDGKPVMRVNYFTRVK